MPAFVAQLPLFVRKYIVDFVETGAAAVFALALVFPGSVADTKAIAIAIGVAMVGAAVSAGRRALPDIFEYLRGLLGVGSE